MLSLKNVLKNKLQCPKCGGHDAYKVRAEGYYTKVQCPQCGYATWLKHYRAEILAKKAQDKAVNWEFDANGDNVAI